MGVAGLGLEPDIDRDVAHVAELKVAGAQIGADALDHRLADREIDIDRSDLHDGGKLGIGARGTHHLPDGDEVRRNLPVERRLDLGIGVVDRGKLCARGGVVEIGLRGIPFRLGIVEIGDGIDVLLPQGRLPLVGLLRLDEIGLRRSLLSLGLLQLREVGRRLDGEEGRTLRGHGAIDIILAVEEALNAGDEIDRVHRVDRAGGVEVAGHVMNQGRRDAHLRRRRGDVGIGLFAARERDAETDDADSG